MAPLQRSERRHPEQRVLRAQGVDQVQVCVGMAPTVQHQRGFEAHRRIALLLGQLQSAGKRELVVGVVERHQRGAAHDGGLVNEVPKHLLAAPETPQRADCRGTYRVADQRACKTP